MPSSALTRSFSVELDLTLPDLNELFEVTDGETGNILELTVKNNNTAVDLTGRRLVLVFSHPRGTYFMTTEDGDLVIDGSKVTAALSPDSFSPGLVVCELQIYSDNAASCDTLVASAWFNFFCKPSLLSEDSAPSVSQIPYLTSLIDDAEDAASDANAAADSANDAASSANTAAGSADSAASAANTAAAAANAAAAAASGNFAGVFSTDSAYAIGDYCTCCGTLYRFTQPHSAGSWNAAHVTAAKAADDLSVLRGDLKSGMTVFDAEYVHGNLNTSTGAVDTSVTSRIVTADILQFDRDIVLYARRVGNYQTGVYGVAYDASDNISGNFSWSTTASALAPKLIPAGTRFRFMVLTDPSAVSNVPTYDLAKRVLIGTDTANALKTLRNDFTAEQEKTGIERLLGASLTSPSSLFTVNGYYSLGTGSYTSGGSYSTTDYLDLDLFAKRRFLYSMPSQTSVNKVTLFNSSKVYVGYSMDATDKASLLKLAPTAKYARFSAKTTNLSHIAVTDVTDAVPLSAGIFRRVGCIGDSYTAGFIKLTAEGHTNNTFPEYSWPAFMERKTGQIWTNFGKGASSTKSWMTGLGGYTRLSEVQAAGNKCQAYVIGLGINDITNETTGVSLGTSADIGTNADSYYAYYYKLLAAVHAVNGSAKLFCTTLPQPSLSLNVPSYNEAVKDVVAYCKNLGWPVFAVDLAGEYYTDELFANPIYTSDKIRGHYTAEGYQFMAECMLRAISDVMNKSVSDFQDVFEIGYDELPPDFTAISDSEIDGLF